MRPVTLVALAPLLGATDLLIKALGLSLVALPLLALLGVLATLLQRLDAKLRTLVLLMAACAVLSLADLLFQAWALELRDALGIFLPLLLVVLLQPPLTMRDGLRQGGLFAALALLLGALRECLGSGTLLGHAEWLFGPAAGNWTLQLEGFTGLHVFGFAPGAFILLGVLWALARCVLPFPDSKA
ncbi:Rnf-Nqr domain containing protein [Pseudomonas turukhanskensis]|uniref:Electron transport complex subunit E n=1 Tax=Pseudomonas turukhanskensis TaxID=1806536 RepID=A0A9W6NEX4_9PSED|nr:Rnf-Nqr domain containing protein [Pseudomonas turukhanskensis]GLK88242.1 electron transport complex subunit E [Pseudomonas turukhanskensis]